MSSKHTDRLGDSLSRAARAGRSIGPAWTPSLIAMLGLCVTALAAAAVWDWAATARPRSASRPDPMALVLAVAVGGCAATVLLTALARVQARDLVAARKLASSMTRDLTRLALVAQRTTNVVIITDAHRRIEWVNEGFTRLTGFTLDEVRGQVPGSFLQFERTDPATVRRMREQPATTGVFRGEILNRGKHGQEYWLDLDIQAIRDDRGATTGFIAVESDITALVEQRRALAASEARFRSMVEGAEVIVWEFDAAADRFTYVSPRALELGYSIDQWLRPGFWSAHLHPDDREESIRFCKEQVSKGRAHKIQYRMLAGDGRIVWVDDFVSAPDRADDGRVILRGAMVDITDRIQDQERLRIAEERWDFALSGTGDGVWDWDVPAGRVEFSPAWKAMLGFAPDEIAATHDEWTSRIHPDDLDRVQAELHAHLDGRTPSYASEYRLRRKDGEWLWVLDRGIVVRRDDHGHPLRMVGTHANISERKKLEEAAAAGARRQADLNTALEEAQAVGRLGSWSLDIATGRVEWSRQLALLLGANPDEPPPGFEGSLALYAPDDAERLRAAIDHTTASGEPYSLVVRTARGSGGVRIVRVRGCAKRGPDGSVTALFGTVMDVTAEVEREQALCQSQTLLRTVLDILPQRVFWKDLEGRYLGANRAFMRDAGTDPVGQTDHDMPWRGERADSYIACDRRVMRNNAPELGLTEQIVVASGELAWLSTSKVPLHDTQGNVVGVLGTYTDITAQHEAAEQLQRAKAEAEAASRAKSEFLANMSHEIRTPMTAILGYADILESEGLRERAPAQRLECIDTIRRNGEHLLSVINDILDISKIEAGKMTVERVQTRPDQVVRDVLSLMKVKASAKGLELALEQVTPIPATIRTDPVRFRQILVNLVGNAIKFTEVGRVRVAVSMRAAPDPRLVVEVIDSGIGMDPEQQSRLFNQFSQGDNSTTRRFGGTGLGLLISRRLAQMLGGDISVRSTLGRGSAFTLTIDAGDTGHVQMLEPDPGAKVVRDPHPARSADAGQPAVLAGCRILLAEDGPDNQRLIGFHLTRAGAHVTVVENGAAAVAALCEGGDADRPLAHPAPFDVLLLDMQMPVMDGYAAARTLRSRRSAIPIIALTAHAMAGDREKCLQAGCDDYLSKPIDRPALVGAIARHAATGTRDRLAA